MNLSVNPYSSNKSYVSHGKQQHCGCCTKPPTLGDKIKYYACKEPVKACCIGGSVLLCTLLAITNRKTIANFVKNIFK